MSQQLQTFLDQWMPVQVKTGLDMHNGDPSSWIEAWSHREPVSLFGAAIRGRSGWPDVQRTINWVASLFSASQTYDYDLITADVHGDLAYTCGFERYTAISANGEVAPNELRVTQIYRRENGVWKIAHRHGDRAIKDSTDDSLQRDR